MHFFSYKYKNVFIYIVFACHSNEYNQNYVQFCIHFNSYHFKCYQKQHICRLQNVILELTLDFIVIDKLMFYPYLDLTSYLH